MSDTTDTSQAATKELPRPKTLYVILEVTTGGLEAVEGETYVNRGTVAAVSDGYAVRAHLTSLPASAGPPPDGATFIAIPQRSFKRRTIRTETQTKLRLS